MKKLTVIMATVLCASLLSTMSAAEIQNDTQIIEVYEHDCETNTAKLVTIEIPTNSSGEAYDVGDTAFAPYMVIGPDSREKIDNVTGNPYNKILCLEMLCDTDEDGIYDATYMGTGFMVASDVMLTAAHCFDNKVNETRITTLEMRVHWYQNGDTFNSNYCTVYKYWTASGYNVDSHINTDWAVVKLNKPSGSSNHLGSIVGYFGYESPSDERLSDMQVTLTGYPQDDEFYMYSAMGNVLDIDDDTDNITEYCFRHDVDMVGGQSGSPIYNSTNNIVVGINVREYTSRNYNEAMRITSAVSGMITYAHNYTG